MTSFLLLLLACGGNPSPEPEASSEAGQVEAATPETTERRTDVKAPGNLPVKTEDELAAEADARQACVDACMRRRAMEAVAAEVIEGGCAAECSEEHPIEQVEVVPSTLEPIPPPPPG